MAPDITSTAEHLRNALDGRWRDVKNQTRAKFEHEQFRPHYTPNTVIARAKVAGSPLWVATRRGRLFVSINADGRENPKSAIKSRLRFSLWDARA